MTRTKDKFRSLFLAALMVFSVVGGSVAFAGTAAAANDPANLQFAANSGGSTLALESGGQTQSDITFDVDNLNDVNSGQTVDIVVSAEDGVEFSSLNSVNTNTVSVSSSGSVNSDGDIVFSVQPSSSGVNEQITLDGVIVDAPTNTGSYNLTVDVTDNGGSNASTTFTNAFNVGSASSGPTGFLSGRISDQNNNDVNNATVRAVNTNTSSVFTTTSDSAGQYTLEVPAGDYDITVQRQGFSTAQATDQTVTENRTTTANLVIRRLVNPDNITVVDSSPIAVADGSDEASFTVEVTTEDLGNGSQPLANTSVDVSIVSADDNGAVTFSSQTLTTDAQGQATVTLSSTEVQDVGLLFDATNGNDVTTTATASFIPQDGEGVFAAQVKDKDTAQTLENATVYAVRDSRMEQNNISFTVSNATAGDEALFRVIDNDTGAVVDESDYKIEFRDSSDFLRVDELNESDAGVGSGFLGTAGTAASGSFQFNVMPIEAGNYTVQYTTVTDDPADGDFSNVTGAQVTQDLTAEAISERATQTDANPVAQTTADGQATLTNLVADGKNGVNYTVIAQRADYDRQFQTATIQSYDTTDAIIEQLFLLEERQIEPNNVDITQVGVHPPLAETGGAPDPDQITPFDDTSDDTYQQVPRDGSVDVIEISAGATNFQGDDIPVDTNVTVGLNESFDGQFLNTSIGGEVVSIDQDNATITVSTGDDGEATVLLETEQNASTLNAQKTATLETDSTVTDSSNVTFVGTVVYETGSLSGIVTNEDNEPLPNSVVYVEEFEDAGGNSYTIEPVNTPFLPDDRQDALDSEFIVTDESTGENVTVTGEDLRSLEVDQLFTRVSLRNASSVTLLTFPSDGAQYTLPRVPATDPDGVTYTRVAGVQFATGTAGVGDSDAVRVGFTQEANIVIVGAQPVSAEFAVSDLNPQNVTVTQGDNITVTANVTNDGVVSSTQNVEFRVGGNTVATQTVSLNASETKTVTFEDVSTAGLAAGEYEHGVFTNEDSQTATLTVESSSNGDVTFQEVLNTISAFNNGEASFQEVLDVIEQFNNQSN